MTFTCPANAGDMVYTGPYILITLEDSDCGQFEGITSPFCSALHKNAGAGEAGRRLSPDILIHAALINIACEPLRTESTATWGVAQTWAELPALRGRRRQSRPNKNT